MHVERDSRVRGCHLLKRPHFPGKLVDRRGLQGLSQGEGCEEGGPAALLDKVIHSPRILGFPGSQHRLSRAPGSEHFFQVIGGFTHLTESPGLLGCGCHL